MIPLPGARVPAAVRGGGPPWQHRGGGTLHPDGEGRVYSKAAGVSAYQNISTGVGPSFRAASRLAGVKSWPEWWCPGGAQRGRGPGQSSASPSTGRGPSTAARHNVRSRRKRFRALMWEFRRDPDELTPSECKTLEGLFAEIPILKQQQGARDYQTLLRREVGRHVLQSLCPGCQSGVGRRLSGAVPDCHAGAWNAPSK